MAKYNNFIGVAHLPISDKEKAMFLDKLSSVVGAFDNTLTATCERSFGDKLLIIRFTPAETRSFRNINKDRISFDGFTFAIYKCTGYIENFNWGTMRRIDESKSEKDFESAPPFQYLVNMTISGTRIPYKHQRGLLLGCDVEYGTEISDIDFTSTMKTSYDNILKPATK